MYSITQKIKVNVTIYNFLEVVCNKTRCKRSINSVYKNAFLDLLETKSSSGIKSKLVELNKSGQSLPHVTVIFNSNKELWIQIMSTKKLYEMFKWIESAHCLAIKKYNHKNIPKSL